MPRGAGDPARGNAARGRAVAKAGNAPVLVLVQRPMNCEAEKLSMLLQVQHRYSRVFFQRSGQMLMRERGLAVVKREQGPVRVQGLGLEREILAQGFVRQ